MNQNHINTNLLMRMKLKIILQIFYYYLGVYLIGYFVYYKLASLNIIIETVAPKESIINSFYILINILVFTVVLIILIKLFKKFPILKVLELILLFILLSLFFNLFLNILYSVIFAIVLLFLKEYLKSPLFTNIVTTLSVGFIGGYIAYSLDLLPIIVLIFLLGLYDIIAVFYTKHMIYLAENIVNKNTTFVYSIGVLPKDALKEENVPEKNNTSEKKDNVILIKDMNLGTGDFALPLIALVKFSFINIYLGLFVFFSLVAILSYTLLYLMKNKHKVKALPALPLQALFLTIVYIFYLMLS